VKVCMHGSLCELEKVVLYCCGFKQSGVNECMAYNC
jgi:hypothetical protein